jgi:hypothetical protein
MPTESIASRYEKTPLYRYIKSVSILYYLSHIPTSKSHTQNIICAMPHSTHDEIYELSASRDAAATEESSSQSNGGGNVHKGKGCQPSDTLNRPGPYELDGTPVEQRPNATSSQHGTLRLDSTLPEADENFEISPQEHDRIYWIWPETPDFRLMIVVQEYAPMSLAVAAPEPMPYNDFIQLLNDEGLVWLLDYVNQLDNMANFAVAPTADPNKKRCKVGRPRGKILKKNQGDDLDRRICCMHLDEVGFRIQVDGQHRDPWTCYPPNANEDVE